MSQQAIDFDKKQELFCSYDQEYPEIWKEFEKTTLKTLQKGFKNYSAKGIFEIIRWHTGVGTDGKDVYKVNNNFTAFYARKFAKEHPEHKEFFRTRKSKYDENI